MWEDEPDPAGGPISDSNRPTPADRAPAPRPVRTGFSPRLGLFAAVYTAMVMLPFGVIMLGDTQPDRSFAVEFAVALGFIGLAMLGMQSVLSARHPRLAGAIGQENLLQFHRQAGLIAFSIIAVHPVILLGAEPAYWDFLDPRDSPFRALALWTVTLALPALVATALWRERLGISYQWWRLTHGILAGVVVLVGIGHAFRVGHYLDEPWKQALWIGIAGASVASIGYVRLLKPLRLRRRAYRVTAVRPMAAGIWSVRLEPHRGDALRFHAGQFAAVTIADTPFALEQHPFSIASSARRSDHLEFVIKELGDYTARIGEVPVGSRAYVDGPFGSLRLLDRREDAGTLMIAGGIGITPIISMIRTLYDARDPRSITLLYLNDRAEDIALADELRRMEADPDFDLRVVMGLAEPPDDWEGEVGFLTDEMLDRHLPADDPTEARYVLCGPPPMMQIAERGLLEREVPIGRIESERFDIGAGGEVGPRQVQVRRLVIALSVLVVAVAALFASL